jgi:hypothetical protein
MYKYVPLISHFKGRTQAEGVQDEGAEFGAKVEEVTGGWRKVHNEQLHG